MDPIILEPPGTVDPHAMEDEDLIVDASNMNFMHVPAEAGLRCGEPPSMPMAALGVSTLGLDALFGFFGMVQLGRWER